MEVNLKEPIHIEFFGLPGCGKSTISHLLAEKLRAKGYRVYEPSYELDHYSNPLIRKTKKLFITASFFLSNHKICRKIKLQVKVNGYCGSSAMQQMINIIPKISIYMSNKPAVYIWDEGLLQSAISLAFNSEEDVNLTYNSIKKDVSSIKVLLQTDVYTALDRMNKRTTNDSRVEKEVNLDRQIQMLEKYSDICNAICADIVIPTDSVTDSTDMLMSALTERGI